MIITCPSCASEYAIDPGRIGPAGRKVRCAGCRESWVVEAEAEPATLAVPQVELPPAPEIFAPREPLSPMPVTLEAERIATIRPSSGPKRATSRGRGRAPAPPPGRRQRRAAITAACASLGLLATLAAARGPAVALLPGTASLFRLAGWPVNALGLAFEDVRSELAEEGGRRRLEITGTVRNVGSHAAGLPRLALAVEGGRGELLYEWSAPIPITGELEPGGASAFTVRLPSPPLAGRQVVVRFRDERNGQAFAAR